MLLVSFVSYCVMLFHFYVNLFVPERSVTALCTSSVNVMPCPSMQVMIIVLASF